MGQMPQGTLTVDDLAGRIRQKYPQASEGIDDNLELTSRFVSKFPEYGSTLAPDHLAKVQSFGKPPAVPNGDGIHSPMAPAVAKSALAAVAADQPPSLGDEVAWQGKHNAFGLMPFLPMLTGTLGELSPREQYYANPHLTSDSVAGKAIGLADKANQGVMYLHDQAAEGLEMQKTHALDTSDQIGDKYIDKIPGARAAYQAQVGMGVDTLKKANDFILDPKQWPFLLAPEAETAKAVMPLFAAQGAVSTVKNVAEGKIPEALDSAGMTALGLAGVASMRRAKPAPTPESVRTAPEIVRQNTPQSPKIAPQRVETAPATSDAVAPKPTPQIEAKSNLPKTISPEPVTPAAKPTAEPVRGSAPEATFAVEKTTPTKEGDSTMHRLSIKRGDEEVGHITGIESPEAPGTLQIHDSELTKAERGNGLGAKAYQELINHAKESGFDTLRSDSVVSPDASRVWESLKKKGYDVRQTVEGLSGKQYELRLTPEKPIAEVIRPTVQEPVVAQDLGAAVKKPAEPEHYLVSPNHTQVTRVEPDVAVPDNHILVRKTGDKVEGVKLGKFPDIYDEADVTSGTLKGRPTRMSDMESVIKNRMERGLDPQQNIGGKSETKMAMQRNKITIDQYRNDLRNAKRKKLGDTEIAWRTKEIERLSGENDKLKVKADAETKQATKDMGMGRGPGRPRASEMREPSVPPRAKEKVSGESLGIMGETVQAAERAQNVRKAGGEPIGEVDYSEYTGNPKDKFVQFNDPTGSTLAVPVEDATTDAIAKHMEEKKAAYKAKLEAASSEGTPNDAPVLKGTDRQQMMEARKVSARKEVELLAQNPSLKKQFAVIQDTIKMRFKELDPIQREALYQMALDALAKNPKAETRLEKALDKSTRKNEQGSLPGARYDADALRAMAEDHLQVILDRYEQAGDAKLASSRLYEKLTQPQFEAQMKLVKDTDLLSRLEDLRRRSSGHTLIEDPAEALSLAIDGVTLTPERLVKGAIREYNGELWRNRELRFRALEKDIERWDGKTIEDFADFTDKMEHGDFAGMEDRDAAMGQKLREMLDKRRDDIKGLGTGKFEQFLENYFPHLWTNVGRAGDYFSGLLTSKRGLMAGTGFLKNRDYEFMVDGLKAGLEPVTYNPIRMALLRLHEMDKYIMAHEVKSSLQAQGLVRWFRDGSAPKGWEKLSDFIFKPTVTETKTTYDMDTGETSEVPTGGRISYGQYYAPKDAAKVINNFLSPGLGRFAAYRAIRHYNNLVNSVNLGMSAFHAFEVSFNAAASDMAQAIEQAVYHKDIKGAIVSSARALSLGGSVLNHYLLGNRLFAEYMEPGRYHEMTRLAEALTEAGGRVTIDPIYRNNSREAMRNAFKEMRDKPNFKKLAPGFKVAYNSVGALTEALSWPIMNHFVPRMKLGAFVNLAEDALRRLGPDADQALIRHELDKIWDSVDNRHGQLVYDNLFMNRIAKDIGVIAFRSLGWNFGTVSELGGGVVDAAKMTKQLTGGKKVDFSHKTAYAVALPIMAAYVGSLINFMYTGKLPTTVTDMFYPNDGKGNRVWFKTYMGDVINFTRHPVDTIMHKAAPWMSQAYALVENQDYYGTEIFTNANPDTVLDGTFLDGTAGERFLDRQSYKDASKYLYESSKPFSMQNYKMRREEGATVTEALSSAAGVLPAPSWVGKSRAEAFVDEMAKRQMSVGPRSQAEADKMRTMQLVRKGLEAKRLTEDDVYKMADSGKITIDDADKLVDEQDDESGTKLEREFKKLQAPIALRAYELATPEERYRLEEMLADKFDADDFEEKFKPEELDSLEKRYATALKLPVKTK